MPGEESYELYIDAFTPQSIPMSRLAEYMASFAELLGHKDHIHFSELKTGSLSVAARVDEVARPKVNRRLEELRLGGQVANSAKKALKDIDDKLAEDNAIGRLQRGNTKIIEFPGRLRHIETQLGPVIQPGSLDGEIIMIGGRDETINIHIKSGEQIHHCVTSKAIARRLAPHIFASIRVLGTGTWARPESGAWTLKRFEISDFETLDETPLSKLFEGLRDRLKPPEGGRIHPAELMRQLREE
jgi:hypothetical protein